MAYHGRANSTCMQCARECTISLHAARTLREPFHPGTTCIITKIIHMYMYTA